MRLTRFLRLLPIGVVGVLLLAPMVLMVGGQRGVPIENRPSVPRPALDPFGVLDSEFTENADAYFIDAFPYRRDLVRFDARFDQAMGQSSNPTVILGKDGALFFSESINQSCLDAEYARNVIDELARATRVVVASGRELVTAVAPDKASIYPEWLRDRPICVLETAASLAAENDLPNLVLDWERARARKDEQQLYFRLDTHWTSIGASTMSEALVESIAPGAWRHDALVEVGIDTGPRDLTVLQGLPTSEPNPNYAAMLPADGNSEPLTTEPGLDEGFDAADWLRSSYGGAIQGRTLFLHDSFGGAVVPQIAGYFAFWRDVALTDPIGNAEAVRSAERVIWMGVQRRIYLITVQHQLAGEFAAVLRDDLPAADVEAACTSNSCTVTVAGVGDRYVIVDLIDPRLPTEVTVNDDDFDLDENIASYGWFVQGDSLRISGDVANLRFTAVAISQDNVG